MRGSVRIVVGLCAGLLGGFATRSVAESFDFLPPGTGAIAFWAVTIGGLYKGYASAVRHRQKRGSE